MLRILSILLLTLSAAKVWADDLSVIDVRRNITLADDDPVYKDFYLAGSTEALKKNLVITAVRKISIRDASGAQAFGEIQVPVGQLRVIAVYGKLAVAREYKLLSRDELPMLEQVGIMTGDKIDLQGAFVDNKPPAVVKPKRHVSEIAPEGTLTVATFTTAPAPAVPAPALAPPTAPASPVGLPPVPITTTAPLAKGPTPASVSPASPAPAAAPVPEPPQAAVIPTPQKLEKTANSGDNTAL